MASDLETGLRTGVPIEEVNYLDTIYVTNGHDRPLEVLGDGSDARPMGSDTPAVGSWAHGRTSCLYRLAYGYRNGNNQWVWSNWSASHAGDGTAAMTSIPVSSEGHVTHKRIARTTASGAVYYHIVILANATTTHTDSASDATVQEYDEIDIDEAHDRPPAKRYIAAHEGRLILGGEVTDTIGTVAVTQGSSTVTGTGTHFTAAQIGKDITVASDSISYPLQAVGSTTSATTGDGSAAMNYLGSTASAQPYTIQGRKDRFYWSLAGSPEYFKTSGSYPRYADLPGSNLEIVGFGRTGSQFIIFTQKALFEIDVYLVDDGGGVTAPTTAARIDQVGPAVGAVGHRAIIETGDRVIFLARENIYEYVGGGGVLPIGDYIAPFIRNLNQAQIRNSCGIYWRKFGYIVLAVPAADETDNQTLLIGLDQVRRNGQPVWYVGQTAPIADFYGYFVSGAEEEITCIFTNGRLMEFTDTEASDFGGLSGTQSGTVTSGSTTVVTDTGATFDTAGSGLDGLLFHVRYDSDGSVASRVISSNTATAITPETAFATAPAAGDTYAIGTIYAKLRLGRRDLGGPGIRKHFHKVGFEMDNDRSTAATADVDLFLGGSTTAEKSGTIDLTQNWDYLHGGVRGRDLDIELRCITPNIRTQIQAMPIDYSSGARAGR